MLHPNPLSDTPEPGQSALRRRLEVIIFGTGSVAGRRFDITLITLILLSVSIVILDSVDELHNHLGATFWTLELVLTGLFTLEYVIRIWSTHNRSAYILSFWGVIDLLAIVPTYIAFLFPEAAPLAVIRLLRVIRERYFGRTARHVKVHLCFPCHGPVGHNRIWVCDLRDRGTRSRIC